MRTSFSILARYCALRWYRPTTAMCREHLCPKPGVTCFWHDVLHHVRGSYPSFIAHTGSCARPKPSHILQLLLGQWVFAGCRKPLLGNGPSRDYLCNPCIGAWTPTPQCSPGALARFFPGDNGLTSDVTGSAHQTLPAMQLQQGKVFRGCSHSVMFRHPRSLDPQVAPTAVPLVNWAAGPFTPRIARLVAFPEMWHHYVSDTSN